MSLADTIFIKNCKEILFNGTSDEIAKVRPTWEDGTPAHTIKKFGIVNTYDLREEFPAITLRKTYIKSAIEEVLWIYQQNSNNVHDLKTKIWDAWADETGSIGKAYGYQIGKEYVHHRTKLGEEFDQETVDGISSIRNFYNPEIDENTCFSCLNQIDAVLYDLKNNPFRRRIMTNMYCFEDLDEMALYPCAYSCTFIVSDEGYSKLVLNMILNQRSQDMLVANNWNVVQYAALLMMIAQSVDMIPGKMIHVIADAHIYDRHIPIIKHLIERPTYPAPIVHLDPSVERFYDFTPESFTILNYVHSGEVKNIPVAI